jgi:hypothetical protein
MDAASGGANQVWIKLFIGLMSVVSAAVATVQTFLNYPELSEKHKVAGAKFANLNHRLELLGAKQPLSVKQLADELVKIEKQWDKLRTGSPNLPLNVWARIEAERTIEEFEQAYANAKMFPTP